jgi:diketogulonate reductase-like aldo/keto reductase
MKVSAAQVCLRYIVDRGCIMAVGTGSDAATAKVYAEEDLAIFQFKLSAADLAALNKL